MAHFVAVIYEDWWSWPLAVNGRPTMMKTCYVQLLYEIWTFSAISFATCQPWWQKQTSYYHVTLTSALAFRVFTTTSRVPCFHEVWSLKVMLYFFPEHYAALWPWPQTGPPRQIWQCNLSVNILSFLEFFPDLVQVRRTRTVGIKVTDRQMDRRCDAIRNVASCNNNNNNNNNIIIIIIIK